MSKDDNYYDDYSDDFVSDDEVDSRRQTAQARRGNYGRAKAHSKPKGRGKPRGGQKQSPRIDFVAQRMLSASRIKMNELRNQLEDQNVVIRELREENKLMKKTQYRQGKALEKFEDQESDLPRIIKRHGEEVRMLREQLRNQKEKFEKTDRYLRDAEDDLERVTAKMKKYKSLAQDKELPERDELNRKLNKIDLEMEEKDSKIKELNRHIDHLNKNHRHELGVEIARHKETKRQLEGFREERSTLETKLKEKEKELEIKNIYSNRVMRPPHKLPNSYGGTPLDTPPPPRRRVPSIQEMTPREKAKLMEMKRREEMKKARQRPLKHKIEHRSENDLFNTRQNNLEEEKQRLLMEEKERRDLENKFLKEREEEDRRRLRELELQKHREEDDFLRERERMKRESEEYERKEMQKRREREQRETQERRDRDERERRDREDRERRDRDERESRDREERGRRDEQARVERELQERREREIQEREKQERERRAQEERERLENDPHVLEERRKKDLLLARLKAIDDGGKENVSPQSRSPYEDDGSTPSSKKSYTFTRPVQNMHNGKPAYEHADRLKHQKSRDSDDGSTYNPSFGRQNSNSPSRKPNKKSALMDELFGGLNVGRGAKKDDDPFVVTSGTKRSSSKHPSSFPWEEDGSGKQSASMSRPRENSSTLFGGGAALIEDDSANDKTKLLPRRTRHQSNTFSSKPAVSAVDNLEDDIEEVVL